MSAMTKGAFALPGSSLAYRTGTWRDQRPRHRRLPAPCHGDCPAGEDPQAYIARLQTAGARAAWETLIAANPLPAITGRVCNHPCESACNRGQFDEPIAIHAIERHLGDEALRQGWPLPYPALGADAPTVAVVGDGPAGLSAAYHLRRRGIRASLIEREAEPGGLLRLGIPDTRLPKDVVVAEIERLIADGIELRPHTVLGRDVHLDDLRREFAAVLVAPGREKAHEWDVDGARPVDAKDGLSLLKEWLSVGEVGAEGECVVIHGGGNTAVDVARQLRFAGAREVHVVTASALPDDPESAPGDRMNAFPRELAQAREEGVIFHPHHTVSRLILRGDRVVGVELTALRKLTGTDGRLHRVPFEGTERLIDTDRVVPAIGEVVDPTGLEAVLAGRAFIAADALGRVSGHAGLFAGGDALGHQGTVSAAVGDGRRAAAAIAATLSGEEAVAEPAVEAIALEALSLGYFEHGPRAEPPILPVAQRDARREIEGGLTAEAVAAESLRCFSCGDCLTCDNCWTFCPDLAILKRRDRARDGSDYVVDYEYCKGCGVCAAECPTGFIGMFEEPIETV